MLDIARDKIAQAGAQSQIEDVLVCDACDLSRFGVAFIAFIPLYTFLRRTLALKDEQRHLAQPEFVSGLMNEGVFLNDVPGRFSAGHGVRPQEVAPFLEKHGLTAVALLADTGFAAHQAQELAELAEADPAAYEATMEILLGTADDPSLLGASIHLLYIGQKRP
jgi:hypothetical protein